jgi:hypothetical protein
MSKRENFPYIISNYFGLLGRSKNLKSAISFANLKANFKLQFGNKLLFTYKNGEVTYFNVTERQKTIIGNLLNAKLNSML